MAIAFSNSRAALVMAPLDMNCALISGFVAGPLCFLIDGSGRSGKSRLDSTTNLLEQNGARASCIYGRSTDHTLYSAIIKGEFDLFIDLTEELARART